MRRLLAVLLALPGCFLEAPTGAEQSWPPPLGVMVEAVAAGDLDGNGSTDIVVIGSGASHQEGMYLLTGGRDVVLGTGTPVKSFSRLLARDFSQPPIAALYAGGAAPKLYLLDGEATVMLTTLSNTLAEDASASTTIVAGAPQLWIEPVAFPGNMTRIAVSNGSTIMHASLDLSEIRPIPAPGSPTWNAAQAITSYASGMDQILAVADSMSIQRSALPGPTVMQFVWSAVRQGAPWVGQTAIDLDGDMREEIIGFDLASKQLCIVDPGATLPVTPSCVATGSMSPSDDVTLFAGTNFTMNPAPDLVIMQTGAVDTRFTVLEDYTVTAGVLASPNIHPLPVTGGPNGRAVAITAGPGTPNALLMFGSDGAVSCVLGPC